MRHFRCYGRGTLAVEHLENRSLLSVSPLIGSSSEGPRDTAIVGNPVDEADLRSRQVIDRGFLAPTQSQEYVDAIIRLRDALGWESQEPVLLSNGNWYLGPAGENSNFNAPLNLSAADTINVDQVWNGGGLGLNLTGAGVTVGVWDEGPILSTHRELVGRVTTVDSGTPNHHATHVAGTIAATGITAAARGMANGSGLRSYDYNNDFTEMSAAAGQVTVSNHSYGKVVGWFLGDLGVGFGTANHWNDNRTTYTEDPDFGKYTADTQSLDGVLANSRFLILQR